MKQLLSIADAYANPELATFLGIDALHPSNGGMFQCTISKAHDLKAGIFETLEQIDSNINPATYVVVPSKVTFVAWTQEIMVPKLPKAAYRKGKAAHQPAQTICSAA